MYLINEAATLLGVSRTALLYYIDHLVVSPITDDKTGYRYFSEEDIGKLKYCTILRNIGMPVKEIAEYLSSTDVGDREERVALLAEKTRKRITEQQAYLAAAQKLIEPYTPMKEPEIVHCPEYGYCLTGCETGYHFLTTDAVSMRILRSIPIGGFCIIFDRSFFSEEENYTYLMGRAIRITDAQILGIPTESILRLGGCLCIRWRIEGAGAKKNAEDMCVLKAYMEKNRLSLAGVPFCPDVMLYRPDGHRYQDIYLPIKQE